MPHMEPLPSLCGHSRVIGSTVWLAFPEWTLELSQSCSVRGYLSDIFLFPRGTERLVSPMLPFFCRF